MAEVSRLLGISIDRSTDCSAIACQVAGQVLFASAKSFIDALADIVLRLRRPGAVVDVIGLNKASDTMEERLGTHQRA